MFKRTLATVLIILTVLPAVIAAGSVLFAPFNGFTVFDDAWENSINAALGNADESAAPTSPLPEGDRYIVRFKDSVPLSAIEKALDGKDFRQLAESEQRLFAITDENKEFIEKYDAIIEYHESDLVREALAVTSDAALLPSFEQSGIYNAWDRVTAKSNVIVAVLDTGVDRTHEDLADANILPGYDAVTKTASVNDDAVGHGTGVIGLIAATANNGIGIAGAAHGVTILPIKVSASSTTIYSSDLVSAIRFAANSGAKIINMSVGGLSYSYAEQEAVNYAVSKGCILISASGNGGLLPYKDKKSYPASYEGVISVASCNADGERSEFSQYNDMVDVAAPGEALTMPIVEDGVSAYRIDSGTSYSCAIVSAIAALAVSACDEGIRLDSDEFLSLIMNTCNKTRNDELGYGVINAVPIVEAANLPIITGVTDGGVYNDSIKVGFNRGSAMLDGEEFEDGDAIIASGRHSLTVKDGDFEITLQFRLEYEPFSYEFKEFSDYAYFEFNKGVAQLDGFPYTSGEKITQSGRHEFVITDGNETFREIIDIRYSLPEVYGVEDGAIYNVPIEICIVGDGKAFLDGKQVYNRIAVAESGLHTLTVESGSGSVKKEISFEIDFPYAELVQTDYAGAKAATDEENGYVCIYGDSLVGVRLYDKNDLSQYLHFIPTGRIYSHRFTETELILAGDDGITVISRADALNPEAAVTKTLSFEDIAHYVFAEDAIYAFGGSSIYTVDLELGELTFVSNLGVYCDNAYYSDGFICMISERRNERVFVYDVANNSLSDFSLDFAIEDKPICFENGYLAIGNSLFNILRESLVLEFCSFRAVAIRDGLLFTENAIIDISSGKELGRLPFLASDIVLESDGIRIFGVEPITLKVSSDAEGIFAYGAAEPNDRAFSKPENSNDFRQTMFIDGSCKTLSAAAGENDVFAIFEDKYAIYSFTFDGLSENAPAALRFEPEKLFLSGGYVTVSFKNVPYVYIAPTSDVSAGSYIEIPSRVESACTVNGIVYIVSGGRLHYCPADGSEKTTLSVRARAVATDGTRIYVLNGTTLSAYNENLELLAEIETNDGELFVANGVIVGGTLYDTALFAEYAKITNPIDYVYDNVYFSGNGIYETVSSRFIGNLGIASPDAICARPSGMIIAFGGSRITVSKYADMHDIISPPVIEGIADGGIYHGSTTVTFTEGIGHIDGKTIESGAVITEAGVHTFVLTLPFGQSVSFSFTIEAHIEKIEFLVPNRTMSIGETITLRIRFLPNGAGSVPVTYSCDSDGLVINDIGEVTALRTGTYTVVATVVTDHVTLTAQNTITVRNDLITFVENSGIRIDRDNMLLYGIAPGSKASDIIALLSVNKEAYFLDAEQREVEGVVATGQSLVLCDEDGNITDRLTVVIHGDTDGDGYITAYDLLTLERMLKNYQYGIPFVIAGDINKNGVLADNDFRALRNIVLHRTEEAVGTPETNLFGSVDVQTLSHLENGDIIDIALCLNGLKHARGIDGVIEYSGLEFIESVSTGWDSDCRVIGDNKLGLFAFEHRGEENGKAFFVLVSLRFRVTANAGERIKISSSALTAAFESGAKQLTFNGNEFTVGEKAIGDFRIDILNAKPFEFKEDKYDYKDITIPYGNALADIAITRPEHEAVSVSSTAIPDSDAVSITVSRTSADGETKVYTFKVLREGDTGIDSNCMLDSLEIEGFKLLPSFDPSVTQYGISVPFGTEKINIHCKAQNPTAQIVIGDTTLNAQSNAITVTVIAPDGESLVYTIHVTVLPKEEETSAPSSEPPVTEPDDGLSLPIIIVFIALVALTVISAAVIIIKRKKTK
ncbi:MAG: S8 family serine peptidase [Clostridia bacterium]|nr:S8 family serine peptidase [Clostridia bacterium]